MTKRRFALSAIVLALLAGAASTWAAGYSFTRIADDSGSFASFGFAPSINNSGAVAFSATLDSFVNGIYRGSGGAATTISFGGPYGEPSINDAGTVAFFDYSGGSSVSGATYTGSGGGLTTIAEIDLSGYGGLGAGTSINSAGTVAFVGQLSGETYTHIYTSSGGPPTSIADNSGDFDSFHSGSPAINSSGVVAFSGNLAAGGQRIARGSGGPLTTIADTSGPLDALSADLSINTGGTVAFVGDLDAGGSGIFTGSGGALTTVADDSGPFAFFGTTASINSAGAVGFFASTDGGDVGLFTGGNPLTDSVILVGDALDGSTVASLGIGRFGLNDNGQVAFYAALNDGRVGIYRADPLVVPEPSTAALLGAGLAGLLMRRKKVASGKR